MTTAEQQLVERLRESAISIRNDGTPSQVGLSADECDEAAAAITRLVEERDAALDEDWVARPAYEGTMRLYSAAESRATAAEAKVSELTEALRKIVADYDACSGAGPSLSVLHRSIDVDARRALEQSK